MKNKERNTADKIADALDLPLDVLRDIPRIEIIGCSRINVENFRGILDYGENSIKINSNYICFYIILCTFLQLA